MTLVESSICIEPSPIEDDNQSETTDIDFTTLQPLGLSFPEALVQCLGRPDNDLVPRIGSVSIESSSDVHIGDKNIYQGPVTIKQIVYANGSDNLGFERECDSDPSKASEPKKCFKDPEVVVDVVQEPAGFRKGFIWLQEHRPMEIGILVGVVVLFLVVLLTVLLLRHPQDITATSQIKNKIRMVSRLEWLAQPPVNDTTPLVTPVPYVIIHHTATTNCTSQAQCVFQVRQIQTFHIESKGWYDIGYNFLVGGDGAGYEGRGWTVEGAHTYGWNKLSIGIAFIGTFLSKPPPDIQIIACQKLIKQGVELGYIKQDYKLLGARQLFATESPGLALLEEIKKWPHWAKEP